jgi:hypothetical protein
MTNHNRSSYYPLLGDSPILLPGDNEGAKKFLEKIKEVMLNQDVKWNAAERGRLRALYAKWKRRAEGTDSTFQQFGTLGTKRSTQVVGTTDQIVRGWKRKG